MRKVNISVAALIIALLLLYYLGPLQPFVDEHQMFSGGILGILIGFIPSVLAGHLGNRMTEQKNKESREVKLKKFTDDLSSKARHFIHSEPPEIEVGQRRDVIAATVKELSQELFQQDYPPIETIRPESTVYPELPCKWCHRSHRADVGSRGDCTKCGLPMDLWMGSQGQPH